MREPSKHSGKRCTSTLYNPATLTHGKKGKGLTDYDLRVPLIGFGKIADLMVKYSMQGDLVAIVGRLVTLRQGKDRHTTGLYVELIKTLDEEEDEYYEN